MPVDKRARMLALLDGSARQDVVPAAFFIHFDEACHFGRAAVERHLEYFRYTDMDFVKIQYERKFPPMPEIRRPEDWQQMPSYRLDFYEPMLEAVRGLVEVAKAEALVIVTLYSAFMCAGHAVGRERLVAHLEEDPEAVAVGLRAINTSLVRFVEACVGLGVDGFYASTQGGEAGTFVDPAIFTRHVKPFDLALMREATRSTVLNILHVCDYKAPYADLSAHTDYPGQIVNCNPRLEARTLPWADVARLFGRPCMGGLDRLDIIASGTPEDVTRAATAALAGASSPFVLGADCTLPGGVAWENIRAAIAAAHAFRR